MTADPIVMSSGTWNMPLCHYCGAMAHGRLCPRVEEIEYHLNGSVKRVRLRA